MWNIGGRARDSGNQYLVTGSSRRSDGATAAHIATLYQSAAGRKSLTRCSLAVCSIEVRVGVKVSEQNIDCENAAVNILVCLSASLTKQPLWRRIATHN